MTAIGNFIERLREFKAQNVFNPWQDVDKQHDLGAISPQIRRNQLAHFLEARQKARYCLLGEALSYQGGHFSGIAMMSERILLGHSKSKGTPPEAVLPSLKPERTSKPECQPLGFAEPTATMVWGLIADSGLSPYEFLTWNSFAWHPYNPQKGILSNRRPAPEEQKAGLPSLKNFLELFPRIHLIAVGKFAEECLRELGIRASCVRHPANGGANKFRTQMKALLKVNRRE